MCNNALEPEHRREDGPTGYAGGSNNTDNEDCKLFIGRLSYDVRNLWCEWFEWCGSMERAFKWETRELLCFKSLN